MAGIKEIAEMVGVSKASVSLYLNDPETKRVGVETRKKIAAAIKELNYRPNVIARSLSMKKSNSIGVLIPFDGPLFKSTFMQEIVSGIQTVLFNRKYSIVFLPVKGDDSQGMVRHQLEHGHGHDGFVLLGTRYCSRDEMQGNAEELLRTGIPFVVANMPELDLEINQVIYRDPPETNVFDHFLKLGHRDIVLMEGRDHAPEHSYFIQLFKDTMEKSGLSFSSGMVLLGDYEKDVAKSAMIQFLKKKKTLTAVYCLTDTMAVGVYEALKEFGLRIPEDVSVVGRNDSFFASIMTPPLTSVKRPIYNEGVKAAELLLNSIESHGKPRKIFLDSSLVFRASMQPAPKVH